MERDMELVELEGHSANQKAPEIISGVHGGPAPPASSATSRRFRNPPLRLIPFENFCVRKGSGY